MLPLKLNSRYLFSLWNFMEDVDWWRIHLNARILAVFIIQIFTVPWPCRLNTFFLFHHLGNSRRSQKKNWCPQKAGGESHGEWKCLLTSTWQILLAWQRMWPRSVDSLVLLVSFPSHAPQLRTWHSQVHKYFKIRFKREEFYMCSIEFIPVTQFIGAIKRQQQQEC